MNVWIAVGVLLSETDAKKTARLPCRGFSNESNDGLSEGHFGLCGVHCRQRQRMTEQCPVDQPAMKSCKYYVVLCRRREKEKQSKRKGIRCANRYCYCQNCLTHVNRVHGIPGIVVPKEKLKTRSWGSEVNVPGSPVHENQVIGSI